MKTKTVIISLVGVLVLILGAFMIGIIAAFLSHSAKGSSTGFWTFSKGIGIVKVEGTIYEPKDILDQLDEFKKDDSIKAIIIRINSPGGSAAASQEIMQAAREIREQKPVVASMGTVAASGGYYLALGSSKIVANPGTITGSIGVRLEHLMLADLLKWAKIKHETLKSGKFKDIGSFDRPLTDEERALLQGLLDDIHLQFKEAVSMERNIPMDDVEKFADGRVFTGKKALDLKLIDELGGFTKAVEVAKELGGIEGEPRIVEPKKFRYEWVGKFVEGSLGILKDKISTIDIGKLPVYKAGL